MSKFVKLPSGLIVPRHSGVKRPSRVAGLTRRGFIAGLGSALIVPNQALANLTVNQLNGFNAGGVPPAVATFKASTGDAVDRTTYTFTGLDFGPESPDRYIAVGARGRDSAGADDLIVAASCTIGGVVPTKAVEASTGTCRCGIIIAPVPTGTTGQTVVVAYAGSQHDCGIAVWAITGIASQTPTDTLIDTAAPITGGIDVPANGIVLVFSGNLSSATCAPTGYTEEFETTVSTTRMHSGGSYSAASDEVNRTIALTWSTATHPVMVAAAFGP